MPRRIVDQVGQELPVPKIVNIYDAKTHLSALVDRAAAGEEIVIAKAGKPRARLVRLPRPAKSRKPAGALQLTRVAEDFDAPLPRELQRAFEGRGR
jgi:prevent-host-death family protein